MPTSILIRLPDDVVSRFRSLVPARQRNKFLADLVAKAVADQESDLENRYFYLFEGLGKNSQYRNPHGREKRARLHSQTGT